MDIEITTLNLACVIGSCIVVRVMHRVRFVLWSVLKMNEVVKRRRDGRAGVYVHIPFCDRICPYCDFAVTSVRAIPHEAYADALLEEWEARQSSLEGRMVRSIYFGGGTPSRWAPEAFSRVLGEMRRQLEGHPIEEITLECNPVDVTREHLDVWCEAGVTRVSLGCQSFVPEVLEFLGRNHSASQALAAVESWLERGVEVSLDLIYGSPMQTFEMWQRDLDEIARLCERGVHHVSSYHLTIESGTPFARRRARGEQMERSEQEVVAMVGGLREVLEQVGVRPYEVSSWSVPGHESVHNSSYWMGAEYLGLGMGAHSLRIDERGVFRRQNASRLDAYMRAPLEGFEGEEVLCEDHLDERLFVGVRSRFGVSLAELQAQFGLSPSRHEAIVSRARVLYAEGLLEESGERLVPSWEGMQVADMIGEFLVGEGEK